MFDVGTDGAGFDLRRLAADNAALLLIMSTKNGKY